MSFVALRSVKFRAPLSGRLVFKHLHLWLLHVVGCFATKKVPSLTDTVAQTSLRGVALWKYWQVTNASRGGEGKGTLASVSMPVHLLVRQCGNDPSAVRYLDSSPPLELVSDFGCAVKENWEMLPPMPMGWWELLCLKLFALSCDTFLLEFFLSVWTLSLLVGISHSKFHNVCWTKANPKS